MTISVKHPYKDCQTGKVFTGSTSGICLGRVKSALTQIEVYLFALSFLMRIDSQNRHVEVKDLNKIIVLMLGIFFMGCSDGQKLSNVGNTIKSAVSRTTPATIEISEFKNGQLRIHGSCGEEGQILLLLPATKGDNRIIGSPTCKQGRYELAISTFGRPPCGVIVEYGGGKSVKAKVKGADIYCP